MKTLAEIERAVGSLSEGDKEELLRFLAMRLRKDRAFPEPRVYSDAEIASMVVEDEADGKEFRQER